MSNKFIEEVDFLLKSKNSKLFKDYFDKCLKQFNDFSDLTNKKKLHLSDMDCKNYYLCLIFIFGGFEYNLKNLIKDYISNRIKSDDNKEKIEQFLTKTIDKNTIKYQSNLAAFFKDNLFIPGLVDISRFDDELKCDFEETLLLANGLYKIRCDIVHSGRTTTIRLEECIQILWGFINILNFLDFKINGDCNEKLICKVIYNPEHYPLNLKSK